MYKGGVLSSSIAIIGIYSCVTALQMQPLVVLLIGCQVFPEGLIFVLFTSVKSLAYFAVRQHIVDTKHTVGYLKQNIDGTSCD